MSRPNVSLGSKHCDDAQRSAPAKSATAAPTGDRCVAIENHGNREPTYGEAVAQMCRECIYDPKSGLGTWREQVAQCACTTCPLWRKRPGPRNGPHHRSKMDARVICDAELRARANKKT